MLIIINGDTLIVSKGGNQMETKQKHKARIKSKTGATSLISLLAEMEKVKESKKLLDSREKELKARILEFVSSDGVKDSKGSTKLVHGDKLIQNQARVSVKLNANKAEDYFREIGIWDKVSETKEVINEDYVEQAILEELITPEELETLVDKKVTYALVISKYEEETD